MAKPPKIEGIKVIREPSLDLDSASDSASRVQVSEQVIKLLGVLTGEMSVHQLMEVLKFKSRPMFMDNYLNPAIEAGFVTKTNPDSPNSPKQRYVLTDVGRKLLKQSNLSK